LRAEDKKRRRSWCVDCVRGRQEEICCEGRQQGIGGASCFETNGRREGAETKGKNTETSMEKNILHGEIEEE
jgi:hypothetical protein